LKRLDIYIIKKFLGTFFYTIALIISIAIVLDISEKIDDFMEKEAPLRAIIFDYYFNFIPYYVNLFSFLFTFIAVLFFTSQLSKHNEIVAIRASGVSFNRLLVPYFISAAVIGLLSFVLSAFIIPISTSKKIDFENKYIKNAYQYGNRNIHKQIEPGTFIYLNSYNNQQNYGYQFSMEKFENNQLKWKMIAQSIRWDSTIRKWTIQDYYIRKIDGMNEKIIEGAKLDTAINLSPLEFNQRDNVVETMTTPALNQFIERQQQRGVDAIESYLIEKHRRLAYPFSTFILTMVAVSIGTRKMRGGTGVHIGFGVVVSFSYIFFMQISSQFAISGAMSPLLAVWTPNIIFGAISLILYRFTPK
jgi:lipopolysaccharide export system permease protein